MFGKPPTCVQLAKIKEESVLFQREAEKHVYDIDSMKANNMFVSLRQRGEGCVCLILH